MSFDFYLLKNIDFLNKENLVIFAIIIFLIVAFLLLIFWLIFRIVKLFKQFVNKLFGVDYIPDKVVKNKKALDKKAIDNIQGVNISSLIKGSELKVFQNKDNAPKNVEEKVGKSFSEIEQKEISADLDKLKGKNQTKRSFLQENKNINDNINLGSKIDIPVPLKNHVKNDSKSFSEIEQKEISADLDKLKGKNQTNNFYSSNIDGNASIDKKFDFQNNKENSKGDSSIFNGEGSGGIDRRILKWKMRDARGNFQKEIFKAQRANDLNLSQTEREKLFDKYFPKHYGGYISKSEMKKQLEIIKRDPKIIGIGQQRVQVLKEINFLKKIGGIK